MAVGCALRPDTTAAAPEVNNSDIGTSDDDYVDGFRLGDPATGDAHQEELFNLSPTRYFV